MYLCSSVDVLFPYLWIDHSLYLHDIVYASHRTVHVCRGSPGRVCIYLDDFIAIEDSSCLATVLMSADGVLHLQKEKETVYMIGREVCVSRKRQCT